MEEQKIETCYLFVNNLLIDDELIKNSKKYKENNGFICKEEKEADKRNISYKMGLRQEGFLFFFWGSDGIIRLFFREGKAELFYTTAIT